MLYRVFKYICPIDLLLSIPRRLRVGTGINRLLVGALYHGGGRESKGTNKSLFINAPVACNLMGRKKARERGWTGFFPPSFPSFNSRQELVD